MNSTLGLIPLSTGIVKFLECNDMKIPQVHIKNLNSAAEILTNLRAVCSEPKKKQDLLNVCENLRKTKLLLIKLQMDNTLF